MTLNALSQVPRRPAPADRLDVASSPRGKDQMLCIILKIQINCDHEALGKVEGTSLHSSLAVHALLRVEMDSIHCRIN